METFRWLRLKFASQQEGKLKWLKRKQNDLCYIPLEYANDENYIQDTLSNKKFSSLSSLHILHNTRIHPNIRHLFNQKLNKTIVGDVSSKLESAIQLDNLSKRVFEIGLINLDRDLALEFMGRCVGKDGGVLRRLSETLQNDREFVLTAVALCPIDICDARPQFRDDKEIVLKALSNDGWVLEYLSDELHDEQVFECVARSDSAALMFTSERLRNDTSFVMKTLRKIVPNSESMSEREFVLHCVSRSQTLFLFSEEYRDDLEIVESAFGVNCHSLRYASERIRSDREFMERAIRKHSVSFQYLSEELKNDVDLALLSIQGGNWLPEEHCNNRQLVIQAVKISEMQLGRASDSLRDDRLFMLELFRECSSAPLLKYASNRLLSDREFVMESLKINNNNAVDIPAHYLVEFSAVKMIAELTGYATEYNEELYKARMEYKFCGAFCQ